MTSKSRLHQRIRHNHRLTSPTTRPIRNAIALGLALTVSSPVFAGGCDVSDPSNAVCDGFFFHTISYAIDNLNLNVGGDFRTNIRPPDGSYGIDLYALNGSLTLTSAANVVSSHAAAILVVAPNGIVNVESSGNLATSYAGGIDAYSIHGDVSVTNDGSIVSGMGSTIHAIQAVSTYGNASIDNHGAINASAANGYGNAAAYGVTVRGYNATLDNTGSINAHGSTQYGLGLAVGSDTLGHAATTNNSGIVHGDFHADTGYAGAIGIRNSAGDYSTIDNGTGASISANASAGFGKANTYGAMASGNVVLIANEGSISASSHADKGVAYALGTFANGAYGTAVTHNDGDISASADVDAAFGNANAIGANTIGSSNASVASSGAISATATANGDHGFARAIGAQTSANDAAQDNHGGISATASVGYNGVVYAFGSYASGKYGVTDSNEGSIAAVVSSNQGLANAHGLFDTSYRGDVTTTNTGDISATANAAGDATTTYGGFAYAYGLHASGKYKTHVLNSGSISASAIAPFGIAHATGAYVNADNATTLVNDGAISAAASAEHYNAVATGSNVNSRDYALTTNNGSIAGVATGDFGTAQAFGSGTGTWGIHGVARLANDGAISATASAYAGTAHAMGSISRGIVAGTTDNSGTISAAAYATHGLAVATGSKTYALYSDAAMANSNGIHAHADAGDAGTGFAYGSIVLGSDHASSNNSAGGIISASTLASGEHSGQAFSIGSTTLGSHASLTNNGDISATATTTGYSHSIATGATVAGDFHAYANAVNYFYGTVHNIAADAYNAGSIIANATAGDGIATATGLNAVSRYGDVTVVNAGTIGAYATAAANATATGVLATGHDVAVTLGATSQLVASANGATGTATGLSVTGSSVTASNVGAIRATFDGAGGKAFGAIISAASDVTFTNSGSIVASASAGAVGVTLDSPTSTTLVNSGTIAASSAAANSIAVQTGDSTDTIQNTGRINGALVTGGGNDRLANSAGGVWNVVGASTDFGPGDDTISNAGTINLHDASIALGSSGGGGNIFTNSGLVTAFGNDSIDMGAGNPNPFTNTGSVELRNGIAGDALTLHGDWAGSGRIGVDVSPQHGSGDMVHIVGNVAAGSVTAVNVNLVDRPTSALRSLPIVDVTGDATAGSFVLGEVHFDKARSFLVVQGISLTGNIDASNTTPDVFSVGIAVTGVTDSGALAAAIVPGAQGLMNSEVGTWRQRIGVLMPTARGSVGLWTRAFQDSGRVSPGHIANNFGQDGNFSFDQTNSGEEIGADFALSGNLSAGLMLGKAQASQHLDNAGVGRNRISADTRGAYLTWMTSGGFYLDGSYRSMRFAARLNSPAGESRASGKADAFNIELGRSWAFADGFKLVPQIQYTRTTVNHVDTLTGALAGFTAQGGASSRGRAGITLSKDIVASNSAVWTPYASVSAVHDFGGRNTFAIDNNFSGETDTRGTNALVEGGVSVRTGKLEVFGGVNWQDGGALQSFTGGEIGLHYNW